MPKANPNLALDETAGSVGLSAFQVGVLQTLAAQTATFNSGILDVTAFSRGVLYLRVTAVSGTTPTLNGKIQTSWDGTNWFDLNRLISGSELVAADTRTPVAFAQMTGVASEALRIGGGAIPLGRFIRIAFTIGGTTPSFTLEVGYYLQN